jgi:hypothetical protein
MDTAISRTEKSIFRHHPYSGTKIGRKTKEKFRPKSGRSFELPIIFEQVPFMQDWDNY